MQITTSNIPTVTKAVIDPMSSMTVDTWNTPVTSTIQPSVVKKITISGGNLLHFAHNWMISLSIKEKANNYIYTVSCLLGDVHMIYFYQKERFLIQSIIFFL